MFYEEAVKMPFTAKPRTFTASIGETVLGTGDNAVTLGGSNVLPLYYFDNKPDEALKYARQTVEKDPGNQAALLIVSELELQKGNLEAGQQALARVPDERITSPTPYLNVGILLYNKKRAGEAEEYFSKAIAKKPDLAAAYYYRGLARYQLKRTAEAKADLEKSIELDPSGKDAETAKEILKAMK
jgi:tetratricopeptide (TPR) repeat protein